MFILDALSISVSVWFVNSVCIFCVLSLVKRTKISWNLQKIWFWNFTSCFWEPCSCRI